MLLIFTISSKEMPYLTASALNAMGQWGPNILTTYI